MSRRKHRKKRINTQGHKGTFLFLQICTMRSLYPAGARLEVFTPGKVYIGGIKDYAKAKAKNKRGSVTIIGEKIHEEMVLIPHSPVVLAIFGTSSTGYMKGEHRINTIRAIIDRCEKTGHLLPITDVMSLKQAEALSNPYYIQTLGESEQWYYSHYEFAQGDGTIHGLSVPLTYEDYEGTRLIKHEVTPISIPTGAMYASTMEERNVLILYDTVTRRASLNKRLPLGAAMMMIPDKEPLLPGERIIRLSTNHHIALIDLVLEQCASMNLLLHERERTELLRIRKELVGRG